MQCFAESQKKTAGDATAQSVAKSSAPRTGGLSFIDKKSDAQSICVQSVISKQKVVYS